MSPQIEAIMDLSVDAKTGDIPLLEYLMAG
jgi:hypothetical protein